MASTNSLLSIHFPVIAAFITLSMIFRPAIACFLTIFSFGDSLADTGNLWNCTEPNYANHLPYGRTYFHQPTGRFSDGRVVVDFIAEEVGLPHLRPYLGRSDEDFRKGANFAVGGSTAMDNGFFRKKGFTITWTEYSLGKQIAWFKELLPSLCSSKSECSGMLNTSLIIMGEIGGNDYNYPFIQGGKLAEIETYIPQVISRISSAIVELIEFGASTLLVPGNYPIGCIPLYLTMFQSQRSEDYDEIGCIKWLNEFSELHNSKLKDELQRLQQLHPHTTLIYANNFEAARSIIGSQQLLGFDEPFLACCGSGGPYNYDMFIPCGDERSTVCSDPSKYASWDGLHLTEAAYKAIARSLLQGPNAVPSIGSFCPHINRIDSRIEG